MSVTETATSTPGPWHVKQGALCLHVVSDDGTFNTGCIDFRGRGEPNAYLIAAAPDLLAACKLALRAFEHNDAIDWNELELAIAKAEGR